MAPKLTRPPVAPAQLNFCAKTEHLHSGSRVQCKKKMQMFASSVCLVYCWPHAGILKCTGMLTMRCLFTRVRVHYLCTFRLSARQLWIRIFLFLQYQYVGVCVGRQVALHHRSAGGGRHLSPLCPWRQSLGCRASWRIKADWETLWEPQPSSCW